MFVVLVLIKLFIWLFRCSIWVCIGCEICVCCLSEFLCLIKVVISGDREGLYCLKYPLGMYSLEAFWMSIVRFWISELRVFAFVMFVGFRLFSM